MISLENVSKPSCNPTAKPLRKPNPHQQSQDYYRSDFLVLTRQYRKRSSNQTAGLADPGTGAEAALGTYLCQRQLVRGFFTCGQLPGTGSTTSPWQRGHSSLQAANFEGMWNRQQIPAPLPHPRRLARCAGGTGTVPVTSSREEREGRKGPYEDKLNHLCEAPWKPLHGMCVPWDYSCSAWE